MVVVVFVFESPMTNAGQGPEAVDAKAFVADARVERFDLAISPGLAGRDEVQPDSVASPVGHCVTC